MGFLLTSLLLPNGNKKSTDKHYYYCAFLQYTMMSMLIFSFSLVDMTTSNLLLEKPCGTSDKPKNCEPPFGNIASVVDSIKSTSTCGRWSNTTVCNYEGMCEVCPSNNNDNAHSEQKLVDHHDQADQTCWVSDHARPGGLENAVNLTLSFGKRYEVYYITLETCTDGSEMPDSVALFKSSDFGRSWKPWQYYSSDCRRAFNIYPKPTGNFSISDTNKQEVLCHPIPFEKPFHAPSSNSSLQMLKPGQVFGGSTNKRSKYSQLTFSTIFKRTNALSLSPTIIDWMTTTDVRISLMRFPSSSAAKATNLPNHLRPDEFYAFSDISIGGRCKCNGHASDCVKHNGKMICACYHNTSGDDCERCLPGYMDIPWSRGTEEHTQSCKQCNCNFHSDTCNFANDIYLKSNRRSGGSCTNCNHNTTGRQCNECKVNFYRDWTKPMSHDSACKPCSCDPRGSRDDERCDQNNGQCYCKEGVGGRTCNRCLQGYDRTMNIDKPCQKSNINAITLPRSYSKNTRPCTTCRNNREHIPLKRYCKREAAFKARVQSKKVSGNMVELELVVDHIWKLSRRPNRQDIVPYWPPWRYLNYYNDKNLENGFRVEPHTVRAWIRFDHFKCKCPTVNLGGNYLIVTNLLPYFKTPARVPELKLTPRSSVLPWNDFWYARMRNLRQKANDSKCSWNQVSPDTKKARKNKAYSQRYQMKNQNPFFPHHPNPRNQRNIRARLAANNMYYNRYYRGH